MGPLGYIEILDARGNVAERTRIDSFPVHIGRAYGNDVIVSDPYVCAAHVVIERDQDQRLIARDLESLNGIRTDGDERVSVLELRSGARFRIGRTLLRYCSVDHPVPPALAAHEHNGSWIAAPAAAPVAGTMVLVILSLASFLGSVERVSLAGVVSEPLLTFATLLGWAGLWALASRVVVSQLHFPQHVVIACCALLGFFLLHASAEWLEFFFPRIPALWTAALLGSSSILGGLVYGHLGWASAMRKNARLRAALMVGGAALGLSLIVDVAGRGKFSNVMEYSAVVKPIHAALVPAISTDRFMKEAAQLKEELDGLAQKANSGRP